MINSKTAAKGAPRRKNITDTDSREAIRYSNAWIAFLRVTTITVAMMASTDAI